MKIWIYAIFLLTMVISQTACNDIEKIKKSTDQNYKLSKANEFYDKKKWEEANVLYEELLTVFKGTKQFEDLYYKYAYSFYNQKRLCYLPEPHSGEVRTCEGDKNKETNSKS